MTAQELSADEFSEVARFGLAVDPLAETKAAAERIDQSVSQVRARLAPAPTEGLFKTPEEMIDDLEWAKHGAGRVALALKQASELVRDTRRAFARAHAIALLNSTGKSSEQREAEAALACETQQEALDTAEAAYEYAKGVARAIEQTGSMTQTQAGLVKAQMQLAGTGRES